VLTHSQEPLTWENSEKLSGDTASAVAELKKTTGLDLLIQGSSTLYVPLLAAGLIDKLVLITFPVVLGRGKRIFDGSQAPGAFKLADSFVSPKGVVIATYEPAGDVATGTFETKEPSEAERERREKWTSEDA
jgi:dihydrofolate reductase